MTMDAILYGIIHDRFKSDIDVESILRKVPLKSSDGIFFASKAYFNDPIISNDIKIGGIRFQKDQYLFDFVEKSDSKLNIDSKRGKFKSNISRYKCIFTDCIFWIVEGDASCIRNLLDSSKSIGALRKEGYGIIRNFEIEEIGDIDSLADEYMKVRRPIPVRLYKFPASPHINLTAMETWRPPYWDQSGLEECYVPFEDCGSERH